MLSDDAVKRLQTSAGAKSAGAEVADAVNAASNLVGQSALSLAALIVATNVSTTIDFGALKVGDKVLHVAIATSTAVWLAVVTAGTLPEAAVVGDNYLVVRAVTAPAAVNVPF